ncbi:MAG: hypothetical protein AAGF73_17340 [Actinomycetota bacterium]
MSTLGDDPTNEATNRIVAAWRTVSGRKRRATMAATARPHDPDDYAIPDLDGTGPTAREIPLDHTAPDASWDVWPARTLDSCREPLAPDVPDLRGVWEVYAGYMSGHVERIEQAGNRIVITTGGLVHDMFCDGTLDHGVDDTAGIGGRHIRVAATFEDGVHKLRPFDKRVVAVTRRLDGDEMRWRYGPFPNKLRRLTEPPYDHPATRAAAQAAGILPA